jgi:hypothetical protein
MLKTDDVDLADLALALDDHADAALAERRATRLLSRASAEGVRGA